MSEFSLPKILSQKDFDTFFQEALDEGNSYEEAAEDTVEMFEEAGYDLSFIWMCRSAEEVEEKVIVERNIDQVQRSARGEDTYLNASFSLAKLRQVCRNKTKPEDTGIWRMFCVQKFLETLVQLLALPIEEDEEDDEDVEEDIVSDYLDKLRLVLELLELLARNISSRVGDLFRQEQEQGAEGMGIRLPVDTVVALCASMIPTAAPPSTGTLPCEVLCRYLELLQVLAKDNVNQKHFRAPETLQYIQYYSNGSDDASCSEECVGFKKFVESLQSEYSHSAHA